MQLNKLNKIKHFEALPGFKMLGSITRKIELY
jgi:hypothetical protein